jgi:hypothetical protein
VILFVHKNAIIYIELSSLVNINILPIDLQLKLRLAGYSPYGMVSLVEHWLSDKRFSSFPEKKQKRWFCCAEGYGQPDPRRSRPWGSGGMPPANLYVSSCIRSLLYFNCTCSLLPGGVGGFVSLDTNMHTPTSSIRSKLTMCTITHSL